MNAIALALVLFAAVLHASWNFVSKKSGGGSSFVLLYETFAFLIYMPLLYLVDFKRLLSLPLEMWLLIILSAVLHVIYTIVLQTGYRKADYSVVYPTARRNGSGVYGFSCRVSIRRKTRPSRFCGHCLCAFRYRIASVSGQRQAAEELFVRRIVLGCFNRCIYCLVLKLGWVLRFN